MFQIPPLKQHWTGERTRVVDCTSPFEVCELIADYDVDDMFFYLKFIIIKKNSILVKKLKNFKKIKLIIIIIII